MLLNLQDAKNNTCYVILFVKYLQYASDECTFPAVSHKAHGTTVRPATGSSSQFARSILNSGLARTRVTSSRTLNLVGSNRQTGVTHLSDK